MLEVHLTQAEKCVQMRKSENSNDRFFADRAYRLVYNCSSLQAYLSLRRYTAAALHTSNMAAVTVFDTMTSLATHV